MGQILAFIFDDMTDYEVTFITYLLKVDASEDVMVISYEDKIVEGSSGLLYKPNRLVKGVTTYDVEG